MWVCHLDAAEVLLVGLGVAGVLVEHVRRARLHLVKTTRQSFSQNCPKIRLIFLSRKLLTCDSRIANHSFCALIVLRAWKHRRKPARKVSDAFEDALQRYLYCRYSNTTKAQTHNHSATHVQRKCGSDATLSTVGNRTQLNPAHRRNQHSATRSKKMCFCAYRSKAHIYMLLSLSLFCRYSNMTQNPTNSFVRTCCVTCRWRWGCWGW